MTRVHSFSEKDESIDVRADGLVKKFGCNPFSLLDARQGYWQARKLYWGSIGLKSEVGRGENLLRFSDTVLQPDKKKREAAKNFKAIPGGGSGKNSVYKFKTDNGYKTEAENVDDSAATGTSIFDPVLCEIFYKFFVPKGGLVLDPFAGGSVRGIVASHSGVNYHGLDLRKEQVVANRVQAKELCFEKQGHLKPRWSTADARNVRDYHEKHSVDAIFSCPPYVDLEQYSDDAKDLSTLEWKDFYPEYAHIIKRTVSCLKNNRFAAFVVGEVRHKKTGMCVGLVPGTIKAFEEAGMHLYNDAVLVTNIGSLAMRAGNQFEVSRKLGRTHQYCLFFVKGDPRKATDACR